MDKQTWGSGPWQNEPDRKEWRDEKTGLPCLAKRNMRLGNWCGYVAVPPNHPAHGKDYDDVNVDVHGGLIYAGECSGEICHKAAPNEPDNVWWFGFDCGHCMDLIPGICARERAGFEGEVYRTLEYVEEECKLLAQQLVELA